MPRFARGRFGSGRFAGPQPPWPVAPVAPSVPPSPPPIPPRLDRRRFARSRFAAGIVPPFAPAPSLPYRDDDGYAAIVALLIATGEFDLVSFAASPRNARDPAQDGKVAVLTPGRSATWVAQPNPQRKLRVARYALTILVSAPDAQLARAEIDRLHAVAHDALYQVPLGGFTLFDQSVFDGDDYSDASRPANRVTIRGRFGYVCDFRTVGLRTTA